MEDILSQLATLKADFTAANELLEASVTQAEELKAQLLQAAEETAQAKEACITKDTAVANLLAALEASKAEVAALQASSKTAEEKAVAIVATQGVSPIAITANPQTLTAQDARNEFVSLSDPHARAAYYKAHKELLLGK